VKVVVVMLVVSMASLNVAVMLLFLGTLTAPLAGTLAMTDGAVVSRVMAPVNAPDKLPATSRNLTDTVFAPSPAARGHAVLVANDAIVDVAKLSLLISIWLQPLPASLQERLSVTVGLLVNAAPLLIVIEPVGAILSAKLALIVWAEITFVKV
jgi:hypothetical protein